MKKIIHLLLACCLSVASQAQQSASVEQVEVALQQACLDGNADAIQSSVLQLASLGAYGADKLEYASNLLSSIEVNGILFTGSKGDTYPVLMLQFLKSMRTDVRVIHTEWLKNQNYLSQMQSAVGIEKEGAEGIRLLAQKMPVYVSLAAKSDIISALESDLYCTGLAFKCSDSPLANVRSMYMGWWENCGKNHMAAGYGLNANYLVPLAMLASYANSNRYTSEYKVIKQKYAEIAKSVGEKEQLPVMK